MNLRSANACPKIILYRIALVFATAYRFAIKSFNICASDPPKRQALLCGHPCQRYALPHIDVLTI